MRLDASACPLWLYRLLPFLRWWPQADKASLKADGIAGLSGAIIVLPQAVAFAIIAGLPPRYGLYAAMVPTIMAALFGSSWHLVSGPTTAISIVVFASISPWRNPAPRNSSAWRAWVRWSTSSRTPSSSALPQVPPS